MAAIDGYFVLHASRDYFLETSSLEILDKSEDKIESKRKFAELLNTQGAYEPVAFVHNIQSIEQIFGLTNHIDEGWNESIENKKYVVELNPGKGKRSTSVGDIVIDAKNNKVHLVSGLGFTELDKSTFNFKEVLDKSVSLGKEAVKKRNEKYGIKNLGIE